VKSSLARWFVRRFSPKWTVGALGVVRDERGKVLLLEHRWREKPWGLPGGFVAWPESPEAGLVREFREEVGLALQASDFRLVKLLRSEKLPLIEAVYEHGPRLAPKCTSSLKLQASEVKTTRWCDAHDIATREGLLDRHRGLLLELLAPAVGRA
jgi:8-oxo-dGTP diphosphatase